MKSHRYNIIIFLILVSSIFLGDSSNATVIVDYHDISRSGGCSPTFSYVAKDGSLYFSGDWDNCWNYKGDENKSDLMFIIKVDKNNKIVFKKIIRQKGISSPNSFPTIYITEFGNNILLFTNVYGDDNHKLSFYILNKNGNILRSKSYFVKREMEFTTEVILLQNERFAIIGSEISLNPTNYSLLYYSFDKKLNIITKKTFYKKDNQPTSLWSPNPGFINIHDGKLTILFSELSNDSTINLFVISINESGNTLNNRQKLDIPDNPDYLFPIKQKNGFIIISHAKKSEVSILFQFSPEGKKISTRDFSYEIDAMFDNAFLSKKNLIIIFNNHHDSIQAFSLNGEKLWEKKITQDYGISCIAETNAGDIVLTGSYRKINNKSNIGYFVNIFIREVHPENDSKK